MGNVLQDLKEFIFERVLSEDIFSHSVYLLGTLPVLGDGNVGDVARSPAVIKLERTAVPTSLLGNVFTELLSNLQLIERNDIYSWMLGWFKQLDDVPDVKINVIFPATETHIRKYSKQEVFMVSETPELYERIVRPYIDAFPAKRTQWVEDILFGRAEKEKILHRDSDPQYGYVILPDMKWDLVNISSLYLVAISSSKYIRSLRDLRKHHLPMLRCIRKEATRIVARKWNLGSGSLRFYVHYQPSYYHFHVHIVHVSYCGLPGMVAGQAHLLDDIINLLELDSDTSGASIFERMTMTYGLGELHGLFEPMRAVRA